MSNMSGCMKSATVQLEDFLEAYDEECKRLRIKPSAFVADVVKFTIYAIVNGIMERSNVTFFFAGNNYLVTDQRLSSNEVSPLLSALTNLTDLTCITGIDLRYNRLTDVAGRSLAQLIKNNKLIEHLNLMGNDLGEKSCEMIAEALQSNSTLKSIKFTANKIGKVGGMALAQMLQVNEALEELDVSDCDITIDVVIALCTVLRINKTLKRLNISRPLLKTEMEETQVHLGLMLRMNSTLEELHLEKCNLRDFGTERLVDGMVENESLQFVNLRNNRITRDGMLRLCRCIGMQNTNLRHLDLSFNRIQCHGAKYLSAKLAEDCLLETLVLCHNEMKSDGMCALFHVISLYNLTLKSIFLWGNEFDSTAAEAFQNLIDTARLSIENVDLRVALVDGQFTVSQLNNRPKRYYYGDGPFYGNDVPQEHAGFARWLQYKGSSEFLGSASSTMMIAGGAS